MTAATLASPAAARTRLLLEGPIISTLLRLAPANLVVNVVLIAVTASVDAYFVGQLGLEALAGLSLVFPPMMLMQQMANASMGGAMAAAVGKAIGAGKRDEAAALVVHALVIACVAGALFTTLFVGVGPILYGWLGGRGAVLAAALDYGNVIFAGAVVYWLLGALTSVVRATGQVSLLAWVYLGAEALHIVLVPILVFGAGPIPALGATGAGIATVTSFATSSAVLAGWLASGRTSVTLSLRGVRLQPAMFGEILRVGVPMSALPLFNNLALATLTAYAGLLGTASLAGFGIGVRLEYLLYPINFGLGAGVLAMVSTNLGARQFERAGRIAWIGTGLSVGVMWLIGVLAITAPGLWSGLFTDDPEIRRATAIYLGVVGMAYVFVAPNTLMSAFQSTRQPQFPLLAALARLIVVLIGGWIATQAFDTGLVGLGIVTFAGLVAMGSVLSLAFLLYANLGPREAT
ncbi:putative efflux protein, MATE family [Rhodospirillales bacterium URHD0017]|nr:putative efflux protein, MATE family [Rhodospirillales bacterium URHD0017]